MARQGQEGLSLSLARARALCVRVRARDTVRLIVSGPEGALCFTYIYSVCVFSLYRMCFLYGAAHCERSTKVHVARGCLRSNVQGVCVGTYRRTYRGTYLGAKNSGHSTIPLKLNFPLPANPLPFVPPSRLPSRSLLACTRTLSLFLQMKPPKGGAGLEKVLVSYVGGTDDQDEWIPISKVPLWVLCACVRCA